MEKDRTKFIGASDVSAIIGVNPFCTPLKLWSIKTGLVEPDDLSDNEAVEWGQRLERVVSDKFSEKHGVKLIARKTRYVHPELEWLSCELDNIIAGTDELCEIKTINAWAWKQWEVQDELPDHVIIQVQMQLGLSKRKKGWVACLCGGQKYIEKEVVFDPELYSVLVQRCFDFWRMVQDKTPPMAMLGDKETLLSLYPRNNEELQLVEDMNTAIARRQELSGQIKALEEEKEIIENKLKEVIGSNLGIKTSQYQCTWKEQKKQVVDIDAMKNDGVYEGYTKESRTRVLRVSKAKEQ